MRANNIPYTRDNYLKALDNLPPWININPEDRLNLWNLLPRDLFPEESLEDPYIRLPEEENE